MTSTAAVLGTSLNNAGQAVHAWSRLSGDDKLLFAACDASDLAASVVVAAIGDEVDVDDDGSGDATLTDLGISSIAGPGLWLAEDGRVYANVNLDFGAGDVEAIAGFELPCVIPEIFADGFESGDTSSWSSTTTP